MVDTLLNTRDIDFLLYEFLDTDSLLSRPRYQEHSKEIFDATVQTARSVAQKYFANHNAKGDACEPTYDGESVTLIPETKEAWDAVAEFGLMAAHQDFEEGGMQLPHVICSAASIQFSAANLSTSNYHFLTIGAANLIRSFGSEQQKSTFLPPMMDGRFSGTMALTEPDQGSALADIRSSAEHVEKDIYLIKGQKMYISGGDHNLTENIVHMVLAKIKGAPAGVKGISLFIVPKYLVNDDGSTGDKNDVNLAGLLHKMGNRNTTSTVLSFGEKEGAVGYLIGEPHKGLKYMFQMMNEARIGVGTNAAVTAYQGYRYSLEYATQRPQGRLPSNKDPLSKQCMIIRHADVKRMLLAQKAYAEGALALCLYASSLVENSETADTEVQKAQSHALLELLTPIVKSWPSKYGCKANDLAIQVLGGAGYIREYPVEQLYRDQRLNPIHEGTEGIQAIDLLGRKVMMNNMSGYKLLQQEISTTLNNIAHLDELGKLILPVRRALDTLDRVTHTLTGYVEEDPDTGLANASLYMELFGHIVMSWIWLKQANVAATSLKETTLNQDEQDFYKGKIQAARYYIEWELPNITPLAELLIVNNSLCCETQETWF